MGKYVKEYDIIKSRTDYAIGYRLTVKARSIAKKKRENKELSEFEKDTSAEVIVNIVKDANEPLSMNDVINIAKGLTKEGFIKTSNVVQRCKHVLPIAVKRGVVKRKMFRGMFHYYTEGEENAERNS